MRYHIDTIPVWDAYKTDCECPLCAIQEKNELDLIDNFLGASYMEPDRRVDVNEKGFCSHHFAMMFTAKNRLGLALMTHTHLKEKMNIIDELAHSSKNSTSSNKFTALFSKNFKAKSTLLADNKCVISTIDKFNNSCAICDKIEYTMDRYLYTLLYMWDHESEFKKIFAQSKGMCLPHFAKALEMSSKELSSKKHEEFVDMISMIQKKNFDRIEKELEWFTLKFDYRNFDKPWGNSQDAVERTINKLKGYSVGGESKDKI